MNKNARDEVQLQMKMAEDLLEIEEEKHREWLRDHIRAAIVEISCEYWSDAPIWARVSVLLSLLGTTAGMEGPEMARAARVLLRDKDENVVF